MSSMKTSENENENDQENVKIGVARARTKDDEDKDAEKERNNQKRHKLKLLQHVFEHYDNNAMLALLALFSDVMTWKIQFDDLEEYSPHETAFPLLKLVTLNPSRMVVDTAIAAYSEAIVHEGVTTLWSAACRNSSFNVLDYFIANSNVDNHSSLHAAISCNATHDSIAYLVHHYPHLLRQVAEVGRLPLHTACASDVSTSTMLHLVEAYPEAVMVKDWWDNVPLHLACRNGAPLETLQLLLGVNPATFSQLNDNGETPFFCALRCRETSTIILEWFLQVNQNVLFHSDAYGETALHAICYEGSAEHVKWLLEHYRDVPTLQDRKGNTPLHVTLLHSPTPYDVSNVLFQYTPECCAMRGEGGALPLHLAFTKDVPFEFVEYMLEKFPEASETMDDAGQYPLHRASMVPGIPLDVVELVIATCPKAVQEPDKHGTRPLDYAKAASATPSEALIRLLSVSQGVLNELPSAQGKPEPKQKKRKVMEPSKDDNTSTGAVKVVDAKEAEEKRKMGAVSPEE